MVNIENYITRLLDLLHAEFAHRLVYVGLQGSYLRGEATQSSDIDIMVVIEGLTTSDLTAYRGILERLGDFDKSCGFICSREDLANWNPLEICNLLYSTKDYFGVLRELVPAYTREDIRNFVKMSLNNLYHEICHRYIHQDTQKNEAALPFTYKGAFFILQNLHYLRTGTFCATKQELLQELRGKDRAVLAVAMDRKTPYAFPEAFELLFTWCQETLKSL